MFIDNFFSISVNQLICLVNYVNDVQLPIFGYNHKLVNGTRVMFRIAIQRIFLIKMSSLIFFFGMSFLCVFFEERRWLEVENFVSGM